MKVNRRPSPDLETLTEVNVEHNRWSLMSLQLLRDQIKCRRPCSCKKPTVRLPCIPLRLTPNSPQRNKTHCRFLLLISPHRRVLSPPLAPLHESFTSLGCLFLSRGGFVPHKPTVGLQLIEGTSGG